MVLKNYKKLREMLDGAENKFANAKEEIQKALFGGELIGGEEIKDYREERREGVFVADVTNNRWHRLSKNKIWRYDGGTDKGRKYYFYLELVIEEPQRITTQMTVKYYGKPQESFFYRFMKSERRKMIDGNWYNHYFVSSPRGEFESSFELLSNEWMFDLLQYVKNTFEEYLNTMDVLFAKFVEAYSTEFGGAELL